MGSKKILIRIIGLALSLSLVFSGQAGTFHVFAEDMTVENPDSTGSGQGASQDEDYKGALADLGEQLKDLQAQQDQKKLMRITPFLKSVSVQPISVGMSLLWALFWEPIVFTIF